jgi:trk system potassium uptake protein TrkA
MRVRVLITGGGAFGSYLAKDLRGAGHTVTVMDQNPEAARELSERQPDIDVVVGDACEPLLLEKAGILKADVVVAATSDDEDNLVIALLAHKEFEVPRVVARVNDPRNSWLFTDWWGVDHSLMAPDTFLSVVEQQVATAPHHPPAR